MAKVTMILPYICLLLLLLTPLGESAKQKRKQPNIIFILADDMGWGDVSWADLPEIPTPNLLKLKQEGTEMTQFYVQSKCTPSRAALMTSRYAYKIGAGSIEVYTRDRNNSLDQSLKLLPEYLKDLGYATHMAGKWHLGFCSKKDIPTARGFDTFFGSWTNTKDHFHHDAGGYDWNLNDKPYFAANGTYNTHLITNYTQHILTQHFKDKATKKKPVFFYVSYLAPHKPLMVPRKYIDNTDCNKLNKSEDRKICCGMVNAVDEGIGNITATLKELGKLNNTLIIFTSDNGGADVSSASNWPLRGGKTTVYEGGTRARTVFYGPKFLGKAPKEYTGLTHVTDILPTLYQAASGNTKRLPAELDGMSFWNKLKRDRPTDRHWMVYNIDSERDLAAIRLKNRTHDFKLVYWKKDRLPGWTGEGDPEELKYRQRRYKAPADYYRLFNMATNPTELEPNATIPDAALLFPEVKQEMKDKMKELWLAEVPRPYWADIPDSGPGRPKNNNGAFGPGDCDVKWE
ncbi:arylsulfatase B-like isoform X1 [Littorina saxatilis]|uniref:Sulfatase N-terminal domain-containing protein n=1 Tax=Littorina saxatilis TaxID=31220 RepID=A0AAN9GF71_9CAEN